MQVHNNFLSQYLKRSAPLIAAFMMLSFATSGYATVITSGCSEVSSCTLEELFAGGSITVNDKIFENWVGRSDSYFSQVVVTGLDDGGNDPGPGLRYDLNGILSLVHDEHTDASSYEEAFYYDVTTTEESAFIREASLALIDYHFEGTLFGSVEVHQWKGEGEIYIGVGSGGSTLFNSKSFTHQKTLNVETEFDIYAEGQGALGIESFEQRFSQTIIPVPPALWLFGSGLLGLVGIARRRSNTSLPIKRQQHLSRSHFPLRGIFHRNSDMH